VTDRRHVVTEDNFFPDASDLRRVFEDRLGTRRGAPRERFVWDYWHVPGQYTYVRTLANEFFPSDLFDRFLDRLMTWGRNHLGCTKILPPWLWLSYYIDGCRQELHADVPHGPWAFVFSLTNWDERTFTGGETLLLSQDTLDFWHAYKDRRFSELDSFVELIEPRFNRLTVFDPRIPHGVRQVEGTREPLDSRIAVHGWFHAPAVVVSEAVERAEARPVFEATLAMLLLSLRDVTGVDGLATARVDLAADGTVTEARIISSSLVSTSGDGSVEEVESTIIEFFATSRFPRLPEDAWAVMPVPLPVKQDAGARE
jgi:2OG-Fe(II) oxygenase superfamily